MTLLGAWITKIPRPRAALIISFIGTANSATRCAADLHQWLTHMSQMMIVVFEGSHVRMDSETSLPSFERERK